MVYQPRPWEAAAGSMKRLQSTMTEDATGALETL